MEEQKRGIRAAFTAFTLTLILLAAVLFAVRADCVMRTALHGGAVAETKAKPTISTAWLPPSGSALVGVLRAEREVIANLLK